MQKVAGQRAVLDELDAADDARDAVDGALAGLETATSLSELLWAESQAADAYWGAWATLPIPFATRDASVLPEHWLTFGLRRSLLSGGPRLATNPAGAILNYLYALLEVETTLACHALGLDPGLGIFHVDQRDRSSLALDLMEAVRSLVDSYVVALLTQRTLRARDFVETRQGACRLASTPRRGTRADAHRVAATRRARRRTRRARARGRRERSSAAAHAAHPGQPASRVGAARARQTHAPTARGHIRSSRRVAAAAAVRSPIDDDATATSAGANSPRSAWREVVDQAATVLASLRAEQRDPAHGGHAAQIRGRKNAAHQRAVRDWTGERPDPAIFTAEILPRTRRMLGPDLMAATGLSQHYCSLIRLGKRAPHARHWAAFVALAAAPRAPENAARGVA